MFQRLNKSTKNPLIDPQLYARHHWAAGILMENQNTQKAHARLH